MKKKAPANEVRAGSGFFDQVYEVVRLIPPGRVTTYGAIARFLGSGGSARMVGWAMNASHGVWPPIPAQRVVNASGLLSGKRHFGTGDEMKELLEAEGVRVENDQVADFANHFWDPARLMDTL
jgi:methylated-DNA-protein-cysteine methyltransferase-like protein